MQIGKKMQDAINGQINRELYSAYLYLSMSAYFESENLKGFAHWMRKQAHEEKNHAMKFYGFVVERGGAVALDAIEKPPFEWKGPLAVFEEAYEHEKKVTGMIYKLADIAEEVGDRASASMLKWFIDEQVEEEDSANEIIQRIKLAGSSGAALLMLDRELAKRE